MTTESQIEKKLAELDAYQRGGGSNPLIVSEYQTQISDLRAQYSREKIAASDAIANESAEDRARIVANFLEGQEDERRRHATAAEVAEITKRAEGYQRESDADFNKRVLGRDPHGSTFITGGKQ